MLYFYDLENPAHEKRIWDEKCLQSQDQINSLYELYQRIWSKFPSEFLQKQHLGTNLTPLVSIASSEAQITLTNFQTLLERDGWIVACPTFLAQFKTGCFSLMKWRAEDTENFSSNWSTPDHLVFTTIYNWNLMDNGIIQHIHRNFPLTINKKICYLRVFMLLNIRETVMQLLLSTHPSKLKYLFPFPTNHLTPIVKSSINHFNLGQNRGLLIILDPFTTSGFKLCLKKLSPFIFTSLHNMMLHCRR